MIQFAHPVWAPPRSRCPSGALADVPEGRLRTLGSPFFALLLQAQGGAVSEGVRTRHRRASSPRSSSLSKAFSSSWRCFSIVSWGIILYKWWTFRRAARQSRSFLDVFRRSNKFSEVQAVCRSLGDSPLVGLFQAGYAELTAQLRQSTPDADQRRPIRAAPAGRPTLKSLHGRRSRADARVGGRGEQAREPRVRFWRRRRASRRSSACSARSGAS